MPDTTQLLYILLQLLDGVEGYISEGRDPTRYWKQEAIDAARLINQQVGA